MPALNGKTVFITGGSRGIGRAIALRCARDGAEVIIAAKTTEPHPKLPGTIHTVAREIEECGGKALPLKLDLRDTDAITTVVKKIQDTCGKIDILVNNASAILLANTESTPMKRFDLMQAVNVRATYACSQACIPLLKQSNNPHILNLSPPLNMDNKWFKDHVAYTISKYGMSMCTLGMAEEFKKYNIAVNSLWPRTTIATAAVEFNFPKEILRASRTPDIMADSAYAILCKSSSLTTGNFFIDEEVLRQEGVNDFSKYALDAQGELFQDLFV